MTCTHTRTVLERALLYYITHVGLYDHSSYRALHVIGVHVYIRGMTVVTWGYAGFITFRHGLSLPSWLTASYSCICCTIITFIHIPRDLLTLEDGTYMYHPCLVLGLIMNTLLMLTWCGCIMNTFCIHACIYGNLHEPEGAVQYLHQAKTLNTSHAYKFNISGIILKCNAICSHIPGTV